MDLADKQQFVKFFRQKISEKLPEVKKLSQEINYMKYRTYKQKGYVPHWKMENQNRLIRLFNLPVKAWSNEDLKTAYKILKWYGV
jgi:hypothetical protein